jgi:HJR/Mrr/RecB family endonuclease
VTPAIAQRYVAQIAKTFSGLIGVFVLLLFLTPVIDVASGVTTGGMLLRYLGFAFGIQTLVWLVQIIDWFKGAAAGEPSLDRAIAMTPREFEHLTGRALEAIGYRSLTVVGGAGDRTADLVGFDSAGATVVVQCKRYAISTKVGSPAIQQFIGMQIVEHRADRGVFVTTSEFTRQARELAEKHHVVLIDGVRLSKILSKLPSG